MPSAPVCLPPRASATRPPCWPLRAAPAAPRPPFLCRAGPYVPSLCRAGPYVPFLCRAGPYVPFLCRAGPYVMIEPSDRRGGRAVEGNRLLSGYRAKSSVQGSNPCLSARAREDRLCVRQPILSALGLVQGAVDHLQLQLALLDGPVTGSAGRGPSPVPSPLPHTAPRARREGLVRPLREGGAPRWDHPQLG
jgi:hypothetical protein